MYISIGVTNVTVPAIEGGIRRSLVELNLVQLTLYAQIPGVPAAPWFPGLPGLPFGPVNPIITSRRLKKNSYFYFLHLFIEIVLYYFQYKTIFKIVYYFLN